MSRTLRRHRADLLATAGVTIGAAAAVSVAGGGAAAAVLAAATSGLGVGSVLASNRRTRRFVRDHGDLVLRQAELSWELRRLLEPSAILPASRGFAACPDLLATICDLVQERRPQVVVECGAGLSTLTTGLALRRLGPPGARMLTLEHDEGWATETRRRLAVHGLEDVVEVRFAPLVPRQVGTGTGEWYDVAGTELPDRIDLLVVDGPPRRAAPLARHPAGPLLADRLAPGALVVLDDANRPDERTCVERWTTELGWSTRSLVTDTEKGIAVLQVPAD